MLTLWKLILERDLNGLKIILMFLSLLTVTVIDSAYGSSPYPQSTTGLSQ